MIAHPTLPPAPKALLGLRFGVPCRRISRSLVLESLFAHRKFVSERDLTIAGAIPLFDLPSVFQSI
jgi:hypothetical protein